MYPKITDEKELIRVYFKALRCGDITVARLLTIPEFSSGDNYDGRFRVFWNNHSGKTFTDINFCSDKCRYPLLLATSNRIKYGFTTSTSTYFGDNSKRFSGFLLDIRNCNELEENPILKCEK